MVQKIRGFFAYEIKKQSIIEISIKSKIEFFHMFMRRKILNSTKP